LTTRGFIIRYAVDDREYGCIPSWNDHQIINNRERPSSIPEPNENNVLTRGSRVDHASSTALRPAQAEGKGREGERIDVVEARTREPAMPVVVSASKQAAVALGLAFVQAAGFEDHAAAPMNWYGVTDRAAIWIETGWTMAMIVAETRIVAARAGTPMALAYYEKVFATAFARAQRPPPVAAIPNAGTAHAKTTRHNVSGALDDLITAARHAEQTDDGRGVGGFQGAPRLLEQG
jgi:hypothetical protein